MALDATAGGSSADAYCTVAEADTYNDMHPAAADWAGTDASKENCIKVATRWLDERVDWVGGKSTSEQSLRFPRYAVLDLDGYSISSDSIPTFLKSATAELARHIKKRGDISADPEGKGVSSVSVEGVEVDFDKNDTVEVIPDAVQAMLRGYGEVQSRGGVSIVRATR